MIGVRQWGTINSRDTDFNRREINLNTIEIAILGSKNTY